MEPLTNNFSGLSDEQLLKRYAYIGCYGICVKKTRAAHLLGVSRRTIYNMLEDGRLYKLANGYVSVRSIYDYLIGRGIDPCSPA